MTSLVTSPSWDKRGQGELLEDIKVTPSIPLNPRGKLLYVSAFIDELTNNIVVGPYVFIVLTNKKGLF
jgi:hypothetical protein